MRIVIITYWSSSDNYGQQLQCFALQKFLKGKGHEVFLIKYQPVIHISFLRRIWRSFIFHCFTSSEEKNEAKVIEELSRKNEVLNKKRDFSGFRDRYIASTDIVYRSIRDLRSNPPKADVYICGSDQVWNNRVEDDNSAGWFLDFGDAKLKRISYAASVGRELDANEYDLFKRHLSRFDAISVREQKACVLCHKLGFKNAIVAIDPTLLLSAFDYDVIGKSAENTPAKNTYVFVYLLNIRRDDDIYWDRFYQDIKKKGYGIKVVASSGYLPAQDFLPNIQNVQASIPEWLSLVKHSEYVITTSFHGVVFSLIYHKNFYAVLLQNEYSKGNDRIISLLSGVGLRDRIISSESDIVNASSTEICWSDVDEKLAGLRNKSIEFLNNQI